jgi:glutamate-1-semialdehyde 2,1-aminomutase
MEQVSPLGPVYQAGTLSGNPVGMAAGIATLQQCQASGFYDALVQKATQLYERLHAAAEEAGVPLSGGAQGGMFGFALKAEPVQNFADAQAADHDGYARFFQAMLDNGVWLPPSGYEAMFISSAHDDAAIEQVIAGARASFAAVKS